MAHLHKTLDTFVDEYIPKSMLPSEYAFNLDKMHYKCIINIIVADPQTVAMVNKQFFIALFKYSV